MKNPFIKNFQRGKEMKNQSVCFTGHRDISPELIPEIREKLNMLLIQLIEKGYTDFYNGGAIGFDMLSAEAVLSLKATYPHIRLHIIVPCANQSKRWSIGNIERYEKIINAADEVKCLSPVYFQGCMQVRNRYMVDNSSLCIAYLERDTGGSAATAKYAEKQGKKVINIFDNL